MFKIGGNFSYSFKAACVYVVNLMLHDIEHHKWDK